MADVFAARVALEVPVVGELARRRTAEDVRRLRSHVKNETELVEDLGGFAEASAAFHHLLAELAHSQTMALFLSVIDDVFRRHISQWVAVRAAEFDPQLNPKVWRNHDRLVDFIEMRAPMKAEAHWRRHMARVSEVMFADRDDETMLDLYAG